MDYRRVLSCQWRKDEIHMKEHVVPALPSGKIRAKSYGSCELGPAPRFEFRHMPI